jgi:hypothetical protein
MTIEKEAFALFPLFCIGNHRVDVALGNWINGFSGMEVDIEGAATPCGTRADSKSVPVALA